MKKQHRGVQTRMRHPCLPCTQKYPEHLLSKLTQGASPPASTTGGRPVHGREPLPLPRSKPLASTTGCRPAHGREQREHGAAGPRRSAVRPSARGLPPAPENASRRAPHATEGTAPTGAATGGRGSALRGPSSRETGKREPRAGAQGGGARAAGTTGQEAAGAAGAVSRARKARARRRRRGDPAGPGSPPPTLGVPRHAGATAGPCPARPSASSPGRSHRARPTRPPDAAATLPSGAALRPPPSFRLPRRPRSRSPSSAGCGNVPATPPRPPGPALRLPSRHFRQGVWPRRAGARGGSETNSAPGSCGRRWRLRWAGGRGVSTCSLQPVETVGDAG